MFGNTRANSSIHNRQDSTWQGSDILEQLEPSVPSSNETKAPERPNGTSAYELLWLAEENI